RAIRRQGPRIARRQTLAAIRAPRRGRSALVLRQGARESECLFRRPYESVEFPLERFQPLQPGSRLAVNLGLIFGRLDATGTLGNRHFGPLGYRESRP